MTFHRSVLLTLFGAPILALVAWVMVVPWMAFVAGLLWLAETLLSEPGVSPALDAVAERMPCRYACSSGKAGDAAGAIRLVIIVYGICVCFYRVQRSAAFLVGTPREHGPWTLLRAPKDWVVFPGLILFLLGCLHHIPSAHRLLVGTTPLRASLDPRVVFLGLPPGEALVLAAAVLCLAAPGLAMARSALELRLPFRTVAVASPVLLLAATLHAAFFLVLAAALPPAPFDLSALLPVEPGTVLLPPIPAESAGHLIVPLLFASVSVSAMVLIRRRCDGLLAEDAAPGPELQPA